MLLTTPLQAAGEEYAFRGYLLQAIGALTRRAWIALVLTSLLFAMAHGLQNFPLFFDRFMFGLIAGWLVIRTGGLEAGIALHVLNNLLAFGAGILFGDVARDGAGQRDQLVEHPGHPHPVRRLRRAWCCWSPAG